MADELPPPTTTGTAPVAGASTAGDHPPPPPAPVDDPAIAPAVSPLAPPPPEAPVVDDPAIAPAASPLAPPPPEEPVDDPAIAAPVSPLAPPPPEAPVVDDPTIAPAASPPAPPPPEEPTIDDDEQRPRWVLPILVIAVVVGVLVAIGVLVAMAADSGEEYSLDAAMNGLSDAEAVEFDLELSASDIGAIGVSGAATEDLLALSLGDGDTVVDVEQAQVVVDSDDGTAYLQVEELLGDLGTQLPFDFGLFPDGGWLAVDLDSFADDLIGEAVSLLTDPLAVPRWFGELGADPDDAVDLGPEEIDGVPTRHYEATVDLAERVDEDGTLGDLLAQFGLDDLDDTSLDDAALDVTYDAWVTEDSRLRRLAFAVGVGGRQVAMVLDVRALDGDVEIELPPEDDVFELPGLFGD